VRLALSDDPQRIARTRCPQCGKAQTFTAADAGLTVACPACGARFTAPPLATPAPPPPPTQTPVDVRSVQPWLVGVVVVGVVAAAGSGALWWLVHTPPSPPPSQPVVPTSQSVRPVAPKSTTEPAPSSRPTTRRTPPLATRPAASRPARATTSRDRPATTTAAARPAGIVPVRPPAQPPDLDDRIGRAINRGIDYLLTRFRDGRIPEARGGDGVPAGADALAVYALLQAAQATDRPDLHADAPAVVRMLDALRAMPMSVHYTTYDRSLRAAALAVYDRQADRRALRGDAAFLMAQSRNGGYTYDPLPPNGSARSRPGSFLDGNWDNSNSQYGALGVWSALDAGVEVPDRYWQGVRQHWIACQLPNGQWGYIGPTDDGRLSMTVAGVTTLLVAEDQLGARDVIDHMGRAPYTPVVARGLAWLEAGDHAVTLPEDWPTYALYGIERAALASGYKTFGRHDWYRELAARQLPLQQRDGSWSATADPLVDTAFELLFLARGRHPVLMDKLRFDGAWADRPHDVSHLAEFATKELERPMNWQVVSVADDWPSWMDAPVLFLASYRAPPLTPADEAKLRAYAENGGLIFTSADVEAPAFNTYVEGLAARLFPRYPLHDLPPTDPVYRSLYPLNRPGPPPRLQGVSNGSRLLLVHSPGDLGRTWQLRDAVARPAPFQLGLNVFIYAAGRADFLNKLRTTYVPEPTVRPVATTSVARVVYDGDWDPEPAAAGRFARVFQNDTSIRVTVADVDAAALDARRTPLALLTGTGPVRPSPSQLKSLHDYVAAGGVLLVDACGGSASFAESARGELLPHAFGTIPLRDLPDDHPILTGTAPGMSPLDPRLRPFAADLAGVRRLPVQGFTVGSGLVLFCPVDVTTGLLGTHTWGVDGYEPGVAYGLVRNALLWTAERRDR
jgi:hypothetical protein